MYPDKFENLTSLRKYLIDAIHYDPNNGFSFDRINLGMNFDEITSILGKAEVMNIESDQQQTMKFNALIDHPSEGIREHHKLSLLFWGFNRKPFEIIKLHFNYFNNGKYTGTLREFIEVFLNEVISKFGKPEKKTLRMGKEEVLYDTNGHKLSIWRNSGGIRITIK